MGVIGSVFNTYASLYQAKDNDLLMSLPIPALYILLIRVAGVYIVGLFYQLLVMIPTAIVYFFKCRHNCGKNYRLYCNYNNEFAVFTGNVMYIRLDSGRG